MPTAANKVKFGLSQLYYAVLTETDGEYSWATPVAIPGAVSISLDPSGETSTFRADNIDYYVTASNNGYEGDLEVARFPDSFRTDVLGETQTETEKVLIENANTRPKPFALLFQFEGDQSGTRHVLYNCSTTRPAVSSQTTDETIEPVTETVTITASPLNDGVVKASTNAETTTAAYNAWYTKVFEPADSAG